MRAALLAAVLVAACASAPAQPPAPVTITDPVWGIPVLACAGHFEQGGFVICTAPPGAKITVNNEEVATADQQGKAVVGFDRDSPLKVGISAIAPGDRRALVATVKPQVYDIQRVDGLPQDTVTPSDPALLARIKRETAMKSKGFASRVEAYGYQEPWLWPIDGRMSGAWGNQRVLNGTPASPHMGFDIAAPTGTPIKAPASGIVSLAEPDMHFEGGLVFIDHGQGLVSMYLHMSRLDVKAGDVVVRGQVIGAVGAKGRATGPHLCWRMKWRDRNLDPALMPVEALKGLVINAPTR